MKTLLARKLEWVRPDKWSSQYHMIYQDFARPRYEPQVDVNIYALETRGCLRELEKAASVGPSKHSPCKWWSQWDRRKWKGTRLPQQKPTIVPRITTDHITRVFLRIRGSHSTHMVADTNWRGGVTPGKGSGRPVERSEVRDRGEPTSEPHQSIFLCFWIYGCPMNRLMWGPTRLISSRWFML